MAKSQAWQRGKDRKIARYQKLIDHSQQTITESEEALRNADELSIGEHAHHRIQIEFRRLDIANAEKMIQLYQAVSSMQELVQANISAEPNSPPEETRKIFYENYRWQRDQYAAKGNKSQVTRCEKQMEHWCSDKNPPTSTPQTQGE